MAEETKKNKILLTTEEFQALEDKAKKSDEYFDRLLKIGRASCRERVLRLV